MSATGLHAAAGPTQILRSVRRSFRLGLAVLALVFAYLVYAWMAFDVSGLIASAKPERAAVLATDAVAHKVHVTKLLRMDRVNIAVEGERTATYDTPPDWVKLEGEQLDVDLDDGYRAVIAGTGVVLSVPGYGDIRVGVTGGKVVTTAPEGRDLPDWVRATPAKFDARPDLQRRVQVSRAKIEVHRYFLGWENFFFPFRSPLAGLSAGEVFDLAFSGERLDPSMSNAALIFRTFRDNPDWQHGAVFVALLETLMMAVLGTFTAALVALPLAFLAARNFTPAGGVRFLVRRLFDFVRGIDMLIWSLIFIRAFGLGPLTGALAIAFTDTGTLGKLFSEALENIDRKQVEGVTATGASRTQTYRFGVIPQILPILVSQTLYYLESNTRSATVIGALGAGGIGLMLVETMRTSRDWENTFYIIILTVILVIAMDAISTRLRRRLIHDGTDRGK
ncbi:phosphonate ABC transporter, permease protein PhnE [Minwuia sp.]|uniref:phosphonate ABC transporter, permease protein PhnE n=1 Tax=Minwuia sp. TaxID=2493630 RepID=UPI003A941E04